MNKALQHLAIVMDGNGRWAAQRGLSRQRGHQQGARVAMSIIEEVARSDISYLSLFVLSSENMSRPKQELLGITDMIANGAKEFYQLAKSLKIKLRLIGDCQPFSSGVQRILFDLEKATSAYARPVLNLQVAINYSGRWDLLQAIQKMHEAQTNDKSETSIDSESFSRYLATHGVPDPDLLIRTGGERRLSNFMLWQCAYTELYFHQKMWPEFDTHDLDEAIASYFNRERRFGLVGSISNV